MLFKEKMTSFVKSSLYGIILFTLIIIIHNYNEYENYPFAVKNISIIGNKYINSQEILDLLDYEKNKSVFDFNIRDVKNNIEKIPFIKNAQISLKLPDRLEIQITERVPIALIINNNNKMFIDCENNFLPVNPKSINSFPVPLLNIKDIPISENSSISIIRHLHETYDKMYNHLSEISESNNSITLITDTKTKIFINPNMIINNLNKLKKFDEAFNVITDIEKYKYINLKFNNQIVVKEKNI
tara:strand:- start:15109 stop:15834 length:726 start_codon:yes stop_codon:yes gene_type:complete